ncbi:MAG: hypothetical protein OXH50_13935 [Gemmatimonadetes bacterium]|nr:hypothetical protein [Gemmatimonadota bacterium]
MGVTDGKLEKRFLHHARRLMPLPTAPFREQFVMEAISRQATELGLETQSDAVGNLLLVYRGNRDSGFVPRVIFTAHMDHPGLLYSRPVSPRDHLFELAGNVNVDLAKKSEVDIYDPAGTADQAPVRGVIDSYAGPEGGRPVFSVRTARADSGLLTPDSFAMWRLPVLRQQGRLLRGRACDDLAGVTVGLAVMDHLRRSRSRTCAGLLLTRAEETGFGGMMAAVRGGWLPREPLYINIECSSRRAGAALGAGPVIRVGDRISVFDPRLCAGLVAMAEGEAESFEGRGLPYQRKLMDGGACEATVLALAGFQVGAVALPLDHYHNWGRKRLRPEAIDIGDAGALVKLLVRAAVCREGVAGSGEGVQRNVERRLETRYRSQRPRLEEARSPRPLGGIPK